MSSELKIKMAGPDRYATIVQDDAIVFTVGGKIVGTVKATYDLTELDPALYDMAMSTMSSQIVLISPGVAHSIWPGQYAEPVPFKPLAGPLEWLMGKFGLGVD